MMIAIRTIPGVRYAISVIVVQCWCTLLGPAAGAAEREQVEKPSDDTSVVVLIASKQDQSIFMEFTEAMNAHFAHSNARFEVYWIDALPFSMATQEQLAARVADETNAIAVLWCDVQNLERIYFYLTKANSSRIMVRRLDDAAGEGLADALAIISRSAVEAVLKGGDVDFVSPASPVVETEPKHPPVPKVAPKSPPTVGKKTADARIFADLSYSLTMLSLNTGISNGAFFSLTGVPNSILRISAGYTVSQRLEDHNDYARLELTRHPIHVGLGLHFAKGRFSLGPELFFVVDYLKRTLDALQDNTIVRDAYGEIELSIEPAFRVNVHLRGNISMFTRVGAEIYLMSRKWGLTNGPRFFEDMYRVQPHLLLGIKCVLF